MLVILNKAKDPILPLHPLLPLLFCPSFPLVISLSLSRQFPGAKGARYPSPGHRPGYEAQKRNKGLKARHIAQPRRPRLPNNR